MSLSNEEKVQVVISSTIDIALLETLFRQQTGPVISTLKYGGAGFTFDTTINIAKLDPEQSNGNDYAVTIADGTVQFVTAAGLAATLESGILALFAAQSIPIVGQLAIAVAAGVAVAALWDGAENSISDYLSQLILNPKVKFSAVSSLDEGLVFQQVLKNGFRGEGFIDEKDFVEKFIEQVGSSFVEDGSTLKFEYSSGSVSANEYQIYSGAAIQDMAQFFGKSLNPSGDLADYFFQTEHSAVITYTALFQLSPLSNKNTTPTGYYAIGENGYVVVKLDDVFSMDIDGDPLTSRINFTYKNIITQSAIIDGKQGDGTDNLIIGSDLDDKQDNNRELVGNGGADYIYGGAGSDHIRGGTGDDFLFGDGPDDDSREWGLGNDIIAGDAGNDYIFGGKGDDILIGGDGADTLKGGIGIDRHDGGKGDDILIASGNLENDDLEGDTYDGGAVDFITISEDGTDMLDYSELGFGLDIDIFSREFSWAVKRGGTSGVQDNIRSIEKFILTDYDDKMTVDLREGAVVKSIDGGAGVNDVEYIGGMYDRATGKIYGADGNKAYDPNDTVNFKNINVTHSGFDIGSVAEGNATIAGSVNYAQVQEGADFTMWYLFDGAFGYPYGNSYQNGDFNTRAVFEDSNVTQLLMGGTVIGTDYGDTFNVFQLGTKPFDYDTLRTVDIETGLGDDGDFRRSTANDNCHGAAILYAAGLAG